ncbi:MULTISPECIES: hypothetical protein [unclassified Mesorhizobium]|uniref:hypothetical protein n=1 Tax=unclassified Mesorhizobium TaxID=325217 RepID=UPI000FDA77A5|nr:MULTISPECIES: hypothetical protein [unclassified Mesorhizobium]TGT64088.1 hypothetical protein EN809_035110 [Mesorhizobium sp. M2E.F.Ca.ET.166.01.1.1]TGV97029.1 hypothetical protein EN797_035055 [Mesorhizobium sp. M2E.F.Ca.ET.154.01.1.1]
MPRSAKAKITATFTKQGSSIKGGTASASVGRSVNQFSTSDMGQLPGVVATNLARTIERSNRVNFFATKAETLAKRISDGIDAELRKIGQFISAELIGQRSETEYGGKTSLEIDEFDEAGIFVDWRNLANITRRKKTANKDKFFLHTTALRSEIRAKAGPGLVNLNTGFRARGGGGVVSYGCVTIRPYYYDDDTGKRVYKIADISINLLAGAPANVVRAVLTQQTFNQDTTVAGNMPVLARLMGLSDSAIKKLEGGVLDRNRPNPRNRSGFKIGSVHNGFTGQSMNFYRPLLEPSLAYFFQKRVPLAVEKALNRYSIGKGRTYGGA